jgi:signal transduction histidine kinase
MVRTLRHEIGDLLQTVYATAAILQERLPSDWQLERRIVADLRQRGETTKNLLDTVHDLVCPLLLNVEPVDLAEVASRAAASTAVRHPRLQISAEAGGPAVVQGDARRLAQAAHLILVPACQLARKRVELRTKAEPNRGEVEWTVVDDGPGMPAEQLERVFVPFSTTRHSFPSLALSLSRKIVQLHGGRITAENGPEGGFRVQVLLPCQAPAEAH